MSDRRTLLGLEIHNKSDFKAITRLLNRHIKRELEEDRLNDFYVYFGDEEIYISVKNIYAFNFDTFDIEKLSVAECLELGVKGACIDALDIREDGSAKMSLTGYSYTSRMRHSGGEHGYPVVFNGSVIEPSEKYRNKGRNYSLFDLEVIMANSITRFRFHLNIDLTRLSFSADFEGNEIETYNNFKKSGEAFYWNADYLGFDETSNVRCIDDLESLIVIDTLVLHCFCEDEKKVVIIPSSIKHLLFDIYVESDSLEYSLVIPNSLDSLRLIEFNIKEMDYSSLVLYFSKDDSLHLMKSLISSLKLQSKPDIKDIDSAVSFLIGLGFKVSLYG